MAVVALLELRFQPEALEKSHQMLREILVDTRAFDGCLGVDILIDTQDPAHVIVHETWASLEHDAAYRQWRAGAGATALGSVLAGAPTLTVCTSSSDI
ncbi:MAG TPA: antibiotic biosynthesis monooxygenase family protein [Kineosporiaceae bacterium]|nr:antibiotic biosynthesis monooxygenase family protein [Kineosporiaceae bacterium]